MSITPIKIGEWMTRKVKNEMGEEIEVGAIWTGKIACFLQKDAILLVKIACITQPTYF